MNKRNDTVTAQQNVWHTVPSINTPSPAVQDNFQGVGAARRSYSETKAWFAKIRIDPSLETSLP